MAPRFYNKDGTLTRYALACGYIEKRDAHGYTGRNASGEWYVTLEQISSNGALRVSVSGRYDRRELYAGTKLKDARKAYRQAKPVTE